MILITPALEESVPSLDLILVPGVAFDEHCNRVSLGRHPHQSLPYSIGLS
jgi:5-formyltetrahydrofolate cyclo-ligase